MSFEGWVRDHNQGKKVSSLEYQVYEELAKKEGHKILQESIHLFNLHHIVCTHRYGHLQLGEIAVWIGATATHRDDAFKATRFVIDQIKCRLPIWKKEHYFEQKPEWVFCKDHHTHVHFHEKDYYQKQKNIVNQQSLFDAQVLVVGAGGLGCPLLQALTTAGVGRIDIVDHDIISISNIHRQPLYSPEVVGEKKVTVAQKKLAALNPFIHVQGHDLRLESKNVEKLILGKTLILDCTDNLETKYLLHDACFKLRIPLISASIYQFEGQIRTFIPGENSGCMRCLQDKTPEDSKLGNCNDFGVLGSAVGFLGNLQANEAILYLQNKQNNSIESTFYFDLKTLSQMRIKNFVKTNCLTCKGQVDLIVDDLEISVQDLYRRDAKMIDLRDQEDSIILDYINLNKMVVLYCHRGIRSKAIVKEMRARGYSHFYSLRGGADSMSHHRPIS